MEMHPNTRHEAITTASSFATLADSQLAFDTPRAAASAAIAQVYATLATVLPAEPFPSDDVIRTLVATAAESERDRLRARFREVFALDDPDIDRSSLTTDALLTGEEVLFDGH